MWKVLVRGGLIMLRKKKVVVKRDTAIINDKSPFAFKEAYRTLRTNLNFMTFSGEVRAIAITSSMQDEGKSSVSINLARVLTLSGHRVLLVDADLRKPTLQRYLRVRKQFGTGFSSLLSGQANLDDVVYHFQPLEFDVIFSGPIPPNASELLGRDSTKQLIDDMKTKYDFIIFDTPPSGVVTDASVLAQKLDGVIFTVRHKLAEKDVVRRAIKSLQSTDVNILGIVFNDYVSSSGETNYSYYGE